MGYTPFVPGDVPSSQRERFISNYIRMTKGTNNLFLFAMDHKMEHLNDDFYGSTIPAEIQEIEHVFRIAQSPAIGAFATSPGLIARYAHAYPSVAYVMKLNGKTNSAAHAPWWYKPFVADPYSTPLWSVDQAVTIAQQMGISLCGIGLTLYLGSSYEEKMLTNASQIVYHAHQEGLVAFLWIYVRGRAIRNQFDAHLAAGAAGVATSLGADFVKIHPPQAADSQQAGRLLQEVTAAAGNTGVICSGGTSIDSTLLLDRIRNQLQEGKTRGCAIGRNLFQLPLNEAEQLAQEIAALIYSSPLV